VSWPFSRLDQLADAVLGKMLDKQKNRGTPRPYLRNINVRWGTFDLSDVQQMPFEDHETARFSVQRGDLVVCEGGEPGRCAVWSREDPIFIQKAVHRVRCGEKLNPMFLAYWLRHLAASGELADLTTGTTIQHLPGVTLAALRVPHPPVHEQHRIVATIETQLSRLDAAVASLTRAKANVKRARASVLKAAVEGRLVPTEAALARTEGRDYEPAVTLLARILVERQAAWTASGAKGKYKEPVAPETEGLHKLPEGWCWTSLPPNERRSVTASSTSSGRTATSCATTGCRMATTWSSSRTCCSSRWPTSRPSAPWKRPSPVPEGYDWPSLNARDGVALEQHYRALLEHLGKQHGLLGLVFRKAQNKIQDPAKLKRLISDLIDREQWVMVDADIKGDAYEGLLERNAQDTKSGAGQYFTPRPLIDAMVEVMNPRPARPSSTRPAARAASCSRRTTGSPRSTPTSRASSASTCADALRGVEIVQGSPDCAR
jgi:hypothetical protein